MEKTLQIINQMQQEGIIKKYAIGGGIAAIFYVEPITTFDLDIFVLLPENTALLASLAPIYSWLQKRGYFPEKEQIIIEGIPVQFIPAYNELVNEAVVNASEISYGKTPTHVIKPEYLLAIMLQTFRPQDKQRIILFLDEAEYSIDLLNRILLKYGLKEKYEKFRSDFYE